MCTSSDFDSVLALREQLAGEMQRAKRELGIDQWGALLVGVSDQGEVAAYPCLLQLPFHYPATVEELDELGPDHFTFPQDSWELRWKSVPEFVRQYDEYSALTSNKDSAAAEARHLHRRIVALQEACAGLEEALSIFGIQSDAETWWEVLTFHISGPRIPAPPPPVSDIQLLARLGRHTHHSLGAGVLGLEGGTVKEANFNGACTTDATIDLLRSVPNSADLLRGLRKMSLQHTLVTSRSITFLKRALPHVEILYSHYLES